MFPAWLKMWKPSCAHPRRHEAPVHLQMVEPAGTAAVLLSTGAGIRWRWGKDLHLLFPTCCSLPAPACDEQNHHLSKSSAMQKEGRLALLKFLRIMTTVSSSVVRSYLVKTNGAAVIHTNTWGHSLHPSFMPPFSHCETESTDIILHYFSLLLLVESPKETYHPSLGVPRGLNCLWARVKFGGNTSLL